MTPSLDAIWSRARLVEHLEPEQHPDGRARSDDVTHVLAAVARLRTVATARHVDASEAIGRPRAHPTMALSHVWDVAVANATAWADATGYPAKGSGAQSSGGSPAPWCWTHERDVTRCHTLGLECAGERIQTVDQLGDRLGTDPSAMLLTRIESRIAAAVHHLGALAVAVDEHDTRARTTHAHAAHGALARLADLIVEAAGLLRADVEAELAGEVCCWNHQRHDRWAAPYRTVDGHLVCDWCRKMKARTGQWPHQEWIDAVADGRTGQAKRHISDAIARTDAETAQARRAAVGPKGTGPGVDYLDLENAELRAARAAALDTQEKSQ